MRTVFESVPDAIGTFGLLGVDLLGVVRVETQEIGKLACGVDFRLETVLALREHRGCIDFGAERTCNEVGRLQKRRGAVLPSQACP